MSNISLLQGSDVHGVEWNTISTSVRGVIEKLLHVKTVVKGEQEYVVIATEQKEVADQLQTVVDMFPNSVQIDVSESYPIKTFAVISKDSVGQDILLRKLAKFIISA